jgi:hypothetical protein
MADIAKFKDGFGDTVKVYTTGSQVYVDFDNSVKSIDMEFTPRKARKFAKALKRAAKAVENG